MWTILAVMAGLLLLVFWRGPNSVWGGIAFGAIGGLLWALVAAFLGRGFHWSTVGKGVVVCVLLGVALEWLGRRHEARLRAQSSQDK